MGSVRTEDKQDLDVVGNKARRAHAERRREASERKREQRESLREAAEAARVIREQSRVAAELERTKILESLRESVDSLVAASAQMKAVEDMRQTLYKLVGNTKKDTQ